MSAGEGDSDEALPDMNRQIHVDHVESADIRDNPPEQPAPVVRRRADTQPEQSVPAAVDKDTELERLTVALQRSREDLQRFVYAASHDLQAPVRTVNTYLQLLERRLGQRLHPDEKEMIGYAQHAAKRMHALVLDLLSYSRASTESLKRERVDAEELLSDLMSDFRSMIDDTRAAVTWDAPSPALWADSAAIYHVLHNLLDNALKYRRGESPKIHISFVQEANHWRICMRDNGEGIPPGHTKRVFEMLQRLHGDDLPGSGVGLTVCQRLVERFGGKIWVESEVGRGSIFCFTVPFQPVEKSP